MTSVGNETQQRRLTTIMAADVANYSGLMSRDEEGTLQKLKLHRSVFEGQFKRHNGRIFNTAGDSILAEFGSAVEAVRCAIAVQEELSLQNSAQDTDKQMLFRIGINIGDVLVEEGNLYGDGVNVAARLEALAPAGGICTSASVYELVKGKLSFTFEDIGAQSVKNIPDPVRAYRLVQNFGAGVNPAAGPEKTAIQSGIVTPWRWIIAGCIVLLILGISAFWYFGSLPFGASRKSSETIVSAQVARTNALVGRVIRGQTRRRTPLSMVLKKNGVVIVTFKPVRGNRMATDRGKWWVSRKGHVCFEFPIYGFGRIICRNFKREDGQLKLKARGPYPDWVITTD